jgi:hypothetical protein
MNQFIVEERIIKDIVQCRKGARSFSISSLLEERVQEHGK